MQRRKTADREAGQGTGQLRDEDGIQDAGSVEQKDHEWEEEGEEGSDQATGTIVVDNGDLLRTLSELRGEARGHMGGIGGGMEDNVTRALSVPEDDRERSDFDGKAQRGD